MVIQALEATLAELRRIGEYRSRPHLDGAQGAQVHIAGRSFVSFASNDYLGLANDPRVIEAARSGALRFGVGAGASHLLYGHNAAHDALEHALAAFVGYPRALLFSTGYMANLAVATSLCGRGDEVFADKLNHASLNDAMLLSRARFRRYPHADLNALERALASSHARRRLVVTDAVFSMDGDMVALPAMVELCERYDAWLLLDDAHGFGVFGEHGAGTLSHFRLRSERILYMGTLGKAAGVFGAFVAAAPVIVDYLINRARPYIYTTAVPGLLAAALLESLAILRREDWRREHLGRLAGLLRESLTGTGATLLESQSAIQPLVVGAATDAVRIAGHLKDQGGCGLACRLPTERKTYAVWAGCCGSSPVEREPGARPARNSPRICTGHSGLRHFG
jgi:8-amino-7-oxononanoate synthase